MQPSTSGGHDPRAAARGRDRCFLPGQGGDGEEAVQEAGGAPDPAVLHTPGSCQQLRKWGAAWRHPVPPRPFRTRGGVGRRPPGDLRGLRWCWERSRQGRREGPRLPPYLPPPHARPPAPLPGPTSGPGTRPGTSGLRGGRFPRLRPVGPPRPPGLPLPLARLGAPAPPGGGACGRRGAPGVGSAGALRREGCGRAGHGHPRWPCPGQAKPVRPWELSVFWQVSGRERDKCTWLPERFAKAGAGHLVSSRRLHRAVQSWCSPPPVGVSLEPATVQGGLWPKSRLLVAGANP